VYILQEVGSRPLALGLLVACRFVSGAAGSDASSPDSRDGAVAHDVAIVASDAPLPACADTTPSDNFSTAPFCGAWAGTTQVNAAGSVMNDDLVITLMANMPTPQVDCFAHVPVTLPTAGVFVAAPAPIGGTPNDTSTEYTYFHAWSTNGSADVQASFVVKDGDLSLRNDNTGTIAFSMPYAASMAWWRLRPAPSGGVAGDISADGVTWRQFGIIPGPLPPMVYVDIGAGADDPITVGATAKLSSLDICP
jgi:hypothetical protein